MADAAALREELLRLELADLEAADAEAAKPSLATSTALGFQSGGMLGKDDDIAGRAASLGASLQQDMDAGNYGDAIRRVAGTASDIVLPVTPMGQLGRLVGDMANTKLAQKFAPGAAGIVNDVLNVTDETRRNELAAPGVGNEARVERRVEVGEAQAANPVGFAAGQLASTALFGAASAPAALRGALTRGAGGMTAGGLVGGGGAPVAAMSEAIAPTLGQKVLSAIPAGAVSAYESTEGTTAEKLTAGAAGALTAGIAGAVVPDAIEAISRLLRAEGKIAKAAAVEAAAARANRLPSVDDIMADTSKARSIIDKLEALPRATQDKLIGGVPIFGDYVVKARAAKDVLESLGALKPAAPKKAKPLTVDDFKEIFSDDAVAAMPKADRPAPGTMASIKKILDDDLDSAIDVNEEAIAFDGGTGDLSRARRPVEPSDVAIDRAEAAKQIQRGKDELAFRRDGIPLPDRESARPVQATTPNRKTPLPRGSPVAEQARAARDAGARLDFADADPAAEVRAAAMEADAPRRPLRLTDDEAAAKVRATALEHGTLDAATLSAKSGLPSSQVGRVLPMLAKKAAFRDEVAAVAGRSVDAPMTAPTAPGSTPEEMADSWAKMVNERAADGPQVSQRAPSTTDLLPDPALFEHFMSQPGATKQKALAQTYAMMAKALKSNEPELARGRQRSAVEFDDASPGPAPIATPKGRNRSAKGFQGPDWAPRTKAPLSPPAGAQELSPGALDSRGGLGWIDDVGKQSRAIVQINGGEQIVGKPQSFSEARKTLDMMSWEIFGDAADGPKARFLDKSAEPTKKTGLAATAENPAKKKASR